MPDFPKRADFLRDYLYIDREKLALFLAQILPEGVPESAKRLAAEEHSSKTSIGGSIKIAEAATEAFERHAESLEQMFRRESGLPNLLLDLLFDRGFIVESLHDADPGQVVHVHGKLEILDLGCFRNLWEDFIPLAVPGAKQQHAADRKRMAAFFRILEKLPHQVQMSINSKEGKTWGALKPEAILGGASAFILQHGGSSLGEWHAIGMLDEIPASEEWTPDGSTPESLPDAARLLQNIVRASLGRPYHNWGMTPLFIYRQTKPGHAAEAALT